MKLKLDENGHVVVQDDKPVYVYEDGTENAFDAHHTLNTIKRLNGEAQTNRETAKALAKKVEAFEGFDPEEAKKALDIVSSLDQKKLVDAGEIEKVKAEIKQSYESTLVPQIEEWKGKYESLKTSYQSKDLEAKFSQSEYIKNNISTHPRVMFNNFKSNFAYDENGELFAVDMHGNKIFSKSDPSRYADFDEAFGVVANACPYKDTFFKGNQAQGGGYQGGQGGGGVKGSLSACTTREEQIAFLKNNVK